MQIAVAWASASIAWSRPIDQFLVQLVLVMLCARSDRRDAQGHVERVASERRAVDQAIVEAPALALRRDIAAAGIEQLGARLGR